MEETNMPSEETLRQVILNLDEPVVFKKLLEDTSEIYRWKLLEWTLSELSEKFGNVELPFRVGYNARTTSPQWDLQCTTKMMTLGDFIQVVNSNINNEAWYYFDYKYMAEWFNDKPDILQSLSWRRFGFNHTGEDSTLWIGSKGAHTNCHQDSYGCNLVAQIYGRKEWLLFPPSSTQFLEPTRIPYEESTVYSKFNMFCPTEVEKQCLSNLSLNPKLVTLNRGDVLFVPAGWWHYVESMDLSVSVNTWIPIKTDSRARLKEALVKLIVTKIKGEQCTLSAEAPSTFTYCMNLIEATTEECKKNMDTSQCYSKEKENQSAWSTNYLISQYPKYVESPHSLDQSEFMKIVTLKHIRFSSNVPALQKLDTSEPVDSNTQALSDSIINALCHPDVIEKVSGLLLNKCVST